MSEKKLFIEDLSDLRWLATEAPTPELTENQRNARNAARAMVTYIEHIGEDTLRTGIEDLIADLRHLVDILNTAGSLDDDGEGESVDWYELDDRANTRYNEEV